MIKEWDIHAHFTRSDYLSINRSFIDTFIKDFKNNIHDKDIQIFYIKVDKIELDVMKLIKCITYNEHERIIRWDMPAWKSCICDPTLKYEEVE